MQHYAALFTDIQRITTWKDMKTIQPFEAATETLLVSLIDGSPQGYCWPKEPNQMAQTEYAQTILAH